MSMSFGERLRVAREAKGWNQEDVAGRIGRPLSWLSRIESGRTKNLPEPEEFQRLLRALDISTVDALIAIGYLDPKDIAAESANPFERDDPRWQLVEKLKQVDIEATGATFTLKALGELLALYTNDPDLFTVQSKTSLPSSLDMSASVRNNSTNH